MDGDEDDVGLDDADGGCSVRSNGRDDWKSFEL